MVASPRKPTEAPEAIFSRLCDNYGIDAKISKFVSAPDKMGFESLEEFAKGVSKDTILEDIIKPAGVTETPLEQKGKLVLAIEAIQRGMEALAKKEMKNEDEDLDVLLDSKELKNIKANFHLRYKMVFDPENDVPETLVSRFCKELKMRTLEVKDVWTIKPLAGFQKLTKNKHELVPGLTFSATNIESYS